MPERELTLRQAQRLMELITLCLRDIDLDAPEPAEREPVYTARCLLSPVRAALRKLRIHGLVEGGDGGTRAQPVPLFGLLFYPDLTIRYHGTPILAYEVKYLGRSGRQASIATGLGQAYLYQQAGYKHAGAFLIDRTNTMSDEEIKHAEEVCRSASIEVIVRREVRGLLAQHPR